MAAIVEVSSREFIGQSSPTPYTQFELKFSGLDQIYGSAHNNPLVFLFENNPSSKIQNSIKSQKLKESLYFTLTKFYPFAGKMNGDSSVICNGTGALYLVAEVDATLLDTDISAQIEQYLPLGRCSNSYISEKLVPLAIQVTFFSCGGIAIGLNYSNRIADSWSFAMFLCSWAATCRGETTHQVFRPEFGFGYSLFPRQNPQFLRMEKIEEPMFKKMVMKKLFFSDQEIMSLKKIGSSNSCRNPNWVELVSGFIWKQIIQMKKSNSKANPNTKFITKIEVNLKERLSIPPNAMGNFLVSSPVLTTLNTDLDYGFLVSEFRKATQAFNTIEMGFNYVNYFSDLNEAVNKPEVWSCDFKTLCGYSLYDEVDFGWGKPLQLCPKPTQKPTVLLGKAKNGDGVEAWINLSEDDMAILSNKFLPLTSQWESSAIIKSSRL